MSYHVRHIAVAPPDLTERLPMRDAGISISEPAIRRVAHSRFEIQMPKNLFFRSAMPLTQHNQTGYCIDWAHHSWR